MKTREVWIKHPEFYVRTDIDNEIIRKIIDRRLDELDAQSWIHPPSQKWAAAFNAMFEPYNEMMKWHRELADKYGIILKCDWNVRWYEE
jgi:hypothetical protein